MHFTTPQTGDRTLQMQRYYAVALLNLAAALLTAASAPALQPGDSAPSFHVYTGKQRVTYPSSFAGKVLVLTYETRDTVENNRPFKSRVTSFCASPENASGAVMPLPVINCSGYFGPVRNYCAARVDANSKKENLLLYTDMDGSMSRAFGMVEDASNIVLIDKQGLIRYQNAGRIGGEEAGRIIELIKKLAVE